MSLNKKIKKLKKKISYLEEEISMMYAFRCLGCGVDTLWLKEYYMIHKDIWLIANSDDDGMLCIGCVESRLGRELNACDFTDAPVNSLEFGPKSDRLLNRLTS